MNGAIIARGSDRGFRTLSRPFGLPSSFGAALRLGLLVATIAACTPAAAPTNVIELHAAKLRLTMNGQPAETVTVKAGEPYTFRLAIDEERDHNLYIGAADDLSHQRVDKLIGIPLFRGAGTKEFTITFEAGQAVQFACTLAGHYGTMHGDIIITP